MIEIIHQAFLDVEILSEVIVLSIRSRIRRRNSCDQPLPVVLLADGRLNASLAAQSHSAPLKL